jgi:DHA2 family multidrug resistance protein
MKNALTPYFGPSNAGSAHGGGPATAMLYRELQRQASNWAFVDVFRWLSLLCFFCVAAVWLLKKVKPGKGPAGAH